MKKFFLFAISAFTMFAVGCTTDNLGDELSGAYKLNASVEDWGAGSRAGFDLNNGGSFFWHNGDAIAVGSGSLAKYTTDCTDGATSATFTGYSAASGYAIYPYAGAQGISGTTLTYEFANEYDYAAVDTDFFSATSAQTPMWATVAGNTVAFKHLGGIFAFKFPNLKAGDNQTFTLTADKKIAGEFTVDLAGAEPVFEATATDVAAEKSVTINFSLGADADAVFYVPVPVGIYDIDIELVNGSNVFTTSYKNLSVSRRDIRFTTLTGHTLQGSEATVVELPSQVTDAMEESESVVVENVAGDETVTIEIPKKDAAEAAETHSLTIAAIDSATETIEIVEAENSGTSISELVISVPSLDDAKKLVVDMPNTTVTIAVDGMGTMTLDEVVAATAENTLVVESGVTIEKLIVKAGNVKVLAGATVNNIERHADNADPLTYVYFEEGANLPSSVASDIRVVSFLEVDLRNALEDETTTSYKLTHDIELTAPLTLPAGKSFTLDLNGYTIDQYAKNTAHYAMITNLGDLTIVGSGNIIYQDGGKGPEDSSWGTYVIRNQGNLTISLEDDSTIKHCGYAGFAGTGDPIAYVIDNHSAGKVVINSGCISSPQSRTLRNFYTDGDVVINGGIFKGQVWMQQGNASGSGDHTNKIGTLTINGGEFSPAGADASSVFLTNHSADNVKLVVNGGKFNYKIGCSDANKAGVKGSIVGGIFTSVAKINTNSALFNEGVTWVEDENHIFTVVPLLEQTGENSYAISSAAALRYVAGQVNSGKNYYKGVTFTLANDINLNNEEWSPIGTETNCFMGNFDGNNKVIKNLTITNHANTTEGYAYAGLFGVTEGSEAEHNYIKNFTIENVNIESDGAIVSAAIAYPYYTDIENITVKGDINIKGGNYTAGVLAYTRHCVVAKDLTIEGNAGSTIEGDITVGGVISDIQMNGGLVADYSNFKASGLTIKADKAVGGISGIISGQTLDGVTVENVTIDCDNIHKGIVSGSLGSKSTISNLSYSNVTGATAVVGAIYDTANPVEARIGDVYYKTFVADALANVKAGETITLQADVTLTESLVLTNEGTLDLGGFSISQKQAQSAAYNMIQNKGNWTIKNGTLDYADIAELTTAVNYVSNTIQNSGSLTLEAVKVVNNSGSAVAANGYPHPIDNSGKLVINSGEFTNNANYSSMRIWCTTDTDTEVTINGGTFNGSIDLQNVNTAANKGTLTINNGTFNADTYTNSSVRLLGFGVDVDEINGYIKGGIFNGPLKRNNYVSGAFNSQVFFVSGGKFSVEPTDFYAEGYGATKQGDYYVVSK